MKKVIQETVGAITYNSYRQKLRKIKFASYLLEKINIKFPSC